MSPKIPIPPRALNILALLLLVVLSLQGSIQSAPSSASESSAAETSRTARTPQVFMKLAKQHITPAQRAQVKIALSLHSARSQARGAMRSASFGTGKVKVAIKGGSKNRLVGAKLVHGKAVVRLPKLARGVYKVRATFLGNALLAKARSKARTLRVGGAGGGVRVPVTPRRRTCPVGPTAGAAASPVWPTPVPTRRRRAWRPTRGPAPSRRPTW